MGWMLGPSVFRDMNWYRCLAGIGRSNSLICQNSANTKILCCILDLIGLRVKTGTLYVQCAQFSNHRSNQTVDRTDHFFGFYRNLLQRGRFATRLVTLMWQRIEQIDKINLYNFTSLHNTILRRPLLGQLSNFSLDRLGLNNERRSIWPNTQLVEFAINCVEICVHTSLLESLVHILLFDIDPISILFSPLKRVQL